MLTLSACLHVQPAVTPLVCHHSCSEYAQLSKGVSSLSPTSHVLLDVRATVQYNICKLDDAVSFPYSSLSNDEVLQRIRTLSLDGVLPVYCMCRRGVDSRRAVALLLSKGFSNVFDIQGGLVEWQASVEPEFPLY
jgi:adenylyltransferase and sulfurtransferase